MLTQGPKQRSDYCLKDQGGLRLIDPRYFK